MAPVVSDKAIIIDVGSGSIRAGYSGEGAPSVIIPAVVGRPRTPGADEAEVYVGEDALAKRDTLSLQHPIRRGIIHNLDDFTQILKHVFNKLGANPEEHAILITDQALNPKSYRERMAQIIFQEFNAPFYYVSRREALSLYQIESKTGVVIHVAEDVALSVPIYEGFPLPHAIMRIDIGGRDLTQYMLKLLSEPNLGKNALDIAQDIKETLGYVAVDYDREVEIAESCTDLDKQYTLPDGKKIKLSKERFRCPECLFQPRLLELEAAGIHYTTFVSITKCDVDIRRELYSNIILSGGSTLFSGIADRLQREMEDLAPNNVRIQVVAPEKRQHSAWVGGSQFASQSTFQEMRVSLEEYEEDGPGIVHRKCLV